MSAMHRDSSTPALTCVLGLLVVLLYPALVLDRVVAPEASLKSVPPWSQQWGPLPAPAPVALEAATRLGPRLQGIARDGLSTAIWNPWIGGGRPGWLSSPREGGAPLTALAGLLARPAWVWTALLALQIAVAFGTATWVLHRLGGGAWPACAGGLAYALSGAVATQVLTWQGSALALGPAALLPAVMREARWTRRAAAWGAVVALLVLSGPPALPFVAMALVFEAITPERGSRPLRVAALVLGLVAAMAIALPAAWLEGIGAEAPASHEVEVARSPSPALRDLVVPLAAGESAGAPASGRSAPRPGIDGRAYLGVPVILLAALGILLGRGHARGVWLGALVTASVLCWIPPGGLRVLGLAERPFGVVALAAAALAALGVGALTGRMPPAWRSPVAAALCTLVALRLAPSFAAVIPFAEPAEARLTSPVPAEASSTGARFVAVLAAVPPDLGCTLAAADARAADLSREPAYAALLGLRADGELPLGRVLDASMPRLGVRWLVEPLPLRVVSGEVFAHVETVEAPRGEHGFAVIVPAGATRVGLPSDLAGGAPVLRQGRGLWRLAPDDTLAAESDAWQWFAIPGDASGGESRPAEVEVAAGGGSLPVVWDASGLRVFEEGQGARLWELVHATPLAFLADAPAGPAPAVPRRRPGESVAITGLRPSRIAATVTAGQAGLLVVQVKHRPRLWRAAVDGRPAVTAAASAVWTGLELPPGTHHVELAASLPPGLVALATCGILGLAVLAVAGRRA